MRRIRSRHPKFKLLSNQLVDQIARLLHEARQDRIAIHFEDLSLEPPNQQIQTLNLLLPDSDPDSSSSDQTESTTLPTHPTNEGLTDLHARIRWQIEDEEASSHVFPVGSFGKVVIALTLLLLFNDEAFCKEHSINLDKKACVIYNLAVKKQEEEEIWLQCEPTIRQLLVHVNGFAAMNEYLIAPEGTSLMSLKEFLRVATRITNDKYGQMAGEDWQEYSNANYIFLGLILETLTGQRLWKLAKDKVFDKMGLQETTFDRQTLMNLERERVLVQGFQVSSNGTRSPVDRFNHLDSMVQYAPMGLRSSLRDLAKFIREILLALDGESQCGLDTETVVKFFTGKPISPCGYYTEFGSAMYTESPNSYLYPSSYTLYALGKPKDRSIDGVYRKAGYVDGSGCNMILVPERRISLIVLGNSTGHIDTTFHVSNLILQESLQLSNPINIVKEAIREGELCRQSLRQIEFPQIPHQDISLRHAGELAGTYQHERYEQQIEVNQDATATIRSSTKASSKMHLVFLDHSTVRLVPGTNGLGTEAWSVWRDLTFQVRTVQNRPALIRPGSNYIYKRV